MNCNDTIVLINGLTERINNNDRRDLYTVLILMLLWVAIVFEVFLKPRIIRLVE